MSNEKFTPGPWRWKIFGKDQKCFMVFNNVLDALASLYFHGNKTTYANAALIASAPELYECVCDALTDLDMSEGMRAHFEEVLKKAKGE